MERFLGLLFMLALAASSAAQPLSGRDFWNSDDEEERDRSGNLIVAIVKDRVHFKARVFRDGIWVTYTYRPHSEQVVSVESPDTREEYGYDTRGIANSVTVNINGVRLPIQVDADREIGAGPLHHVILKHDPLGRTTRVGRDAVDAEIGYGKDGNVERLTFPDFSFELVAQGAGNVSQRVVNRSGQPAAETIATGMLDRTAHAQPMCIDPVATQLGLGDAWENTLRFRQSTSRSVVTVVNSTDRVVLYVVTYGTHRFGFSPVGEPLFYDVGVNVETSSAAASSGDVGGESSLRRFSAVTPTRIVFTAKGGYGACVPRASTGAIQSVWYEPGKGVAYRKFHSAAVAAARLYNSQSSVRASGRLLRPAPTLMLACGQTQVCYTYEGSAETCDPPQTYYCDYGSSGDIGSSSGSGGAGGTGNQVAGDPQLNMQVRNALDMATRKLYEDQCRQLLQFYKTGHNDNAPLQTTLDGIGVSATYHLNSDLTYVNGYSNDKCASNNLAYTTVYGSTVWVCTVFKNLSSAQAANVLIHEMLHTLGLEERPSYPYPTNPTSGDINNKVSELCGS